MQACISSANMVTLWGFSKRYEMDMPYFDCRVSMPREDCLPVLRGEASGLRTLVGVERVPTKPDIVLLIVTVCTWSLVHFCIINKPWGATQKWTRHAVYTVVGQKKNHFLWKALQWENEIARIFCFNIFCVKYCY